jgi:hypothetical protein
MRLLLAAAGAISVLALWPQGAHAQSDECDSDPDCVELYGDDYVCISGSLGRYCAPRGCTGDEECWDLYGPDAYCSSIGAESRCIGPDAPAYVPPFQSMCRVGVGGSAGGVLVPLVLLAGLLTRQRKARWPLRRP